MFHDKRHAIALFDQIRYQDQKYAKNAKGAGPSDVLLFGWNATYYTDISRTISFRHVHNIKKTNNKIGNNNIIHSNIISSDQTNIQRSNIIYAQSILSDVIQYLLILSQCKQICILLYVLG